MIPKLLDLTGAANSICAFERPIVFTNGVFDLLHVGHVTYLQQARTLGNSLIVAINSDASARLLNKGPNRPFNSAEDRTKIIAALESVTAVTIFDDDKPRNTLMRIRPDIYVKGGDYDMESLEETSLVRSWGGQALSMPFVRGYSTTSIVALASLLGEQ